MKILEIEYQGEVYVFETTNRARAELGELTRKKMDGLNASEYIEIQIELEKLNKEAIKIDKMEDSPEKAELEEITLEKITSLINKAEAYTRAVDDIEPSTLDFLYIILKNTRRFKGSLNRELFDDMIYELEEQKGDLEAFKIMEEAKQKSFTVFEKMSKAEENLKKPKKTKSQKAKVN